MLCLDYLHYETDWVLTSSKHNVELFQIISINMIKLSSIGNFFVFIFTGIIAIIVGSFMLRGNMHMWDKNSKNPPDEDP